MAAPARDWETDPFSLTGRNGYLYGRGATDNKGPIMAVACAAAELLRRRTLNVDLVMLIEGEEEFGSGGFKEAVHKNKVGILCTQVKHFNEVRAGPDWPCGCDPHQVTSLI